MKKRKVMVGLGVAATLLGGVATVALAGQDFGQQQQHVLEGHAQQQFGVARPLPGPSANQVDEATAEADPTTLVRLAKGLTALS